MIERLPTPWGLVRLGVAPDHPKLKAVSRRSSGSRAARLPLPRQRRGRAGLTHAELLGCYDAVIYAVGAQTDRRLGIPGEDLRGSWARPSSWPGTTATPTGRSSAFDLDVERAVVVGNGNVALDVARMLALTREEIEPTDTTDAAIEAIPGSPFERSSCSAARPGAGGIHDARAEGAGRARRCRRHRRSGRARARPASAAELARGTNTSQRNLEVLREFAARERRPGSREAIGCASACRRSRSSATSGSRRSRSCATSSSPTSDGASARWRRTSARRSPCGLVFRSVGYRGRAASRACRSTRGAGRSERGRPRARRGRRPCPASTARAGSSAARRASSARTRRTRRRRSSCCSRTPRGRP